MFIESPVLYWLLEIKNKVMRISLAITSSVIILFSVTSLGFLGCNRIPKGATNYGKEAAKAVGVGVAGGAGKEVGSDVYEYSKEKYSEGK